MDLNDDVRDLTIIQEFHKLGLVELLTTLHSSTPPATHQRGSKPIDGFFVPTHLAHLCRGGNLSFGDGVVSNHRAVWLDIPSAAVCPWLEESICRAPVRRLQCRDPRVVAKYNGLLIECFNQDQIQQQVSRLYEGFSGRLSQAQRHEYETLDKQLVAAQLHAE